MNSTRAGGWLGDAGRLRHGRAALPWVLGLAALALGMVVYLVDRNPAHSLLAPGIAAHAGAPVFGALGGWLPSWAHAFAFSLFTAAALPVGRVPHYGACVAWGAINVAFELGQHPQVSPRLAQALSTGFWPPPVARPLAQYFLRGTFDVGDLVAACLGALAAAAVLHLAQPRMEPTHAP
jgi:hypothetical protein